MRKTLLVITTLLLTAQAFAGSVTLSVVDDSNAAARWAAIRYSATDANVSGFGLTVTADSGAIFTGDIKDYNIGECTASQKGYGIFPGTIDINEDTGLVDGNGTPIAPNSAPGASGSGPGTNKLILEMGALYEEGNQPDTSGTLILVKVNSDCNVCVKGESTRGNVVLTDTTSVDPCEACQYIAQECMVPNVVNLPLADANDDIEEAGYVVGDITYAYSGAIAAGNVISTNPSAGETPECGTDVDIVVSKGAGCTVPNVVGMKEADVCEAIVTAGLVVGNVTGGYSGTVAVGLIESQSPVGTTQVDCGTAVDVNRSYGPSDCYPSDGNFATPYAQWTSVGRPACWCYPRQCHGDADGAWFDAKKHFYVSINDLGVLKDGWLIKNWNPVTYRDPVQDPYICADFDHAWFDAKKHFRVATNDLTILKRYWMLRDTNPRDPNAPDPNCLTDIGP